jgi:hypothetical protein
MSAGQSGWKGQVNPLHAAIAPSYATATREGLDKLTICRHSKVPMAHELTSSEYEDFSLALVSIEYRYQQLHRVSVVI